MHVKWVANHVSVTHQVHLQVSPHEKGIRINKGRQIVWSLYVKRMCVFDDRPVSSHRTSHQKRPAVVGSRGPFYLAVCLSTETSINCRPRGWHFECFIQKEKKRKTHLYLNTTTERERKRKAIGGRAIRVYSVCLICHSRGRISLLISRSIPPPQLRKTEWEEKREPEKKNWLTDTCAHLSRLPSMDNQVIRLSLRLSFLAFHIPMSCLRYAHLALIPHLFFFREKEKRNSLPSVCQTEFFLLLLLNFCFFLPFFFDQ